MDLYRLYTVVASLGGYHSVTGAKRWPEVVAALKLRQARTLLYYTLLYYTILYYTKRD